MNFVKDVSTSDEKKFFIIFPLSKNGHRPDVRTPDAFKHQDPKKIASTWYLAQEIWVTDLQVVSTKWQKP
jgi:hypothetical protein